VPTKRVKRTPERIGITAAAAQAWRVGDFHMVNRELGVAPCDWSPFDVTDGPPPSWIKGPFLTHDLFFPPDSEPYDGPP
jgi:hypothetical protein